MSPGHRLGALASYTLGALFMAGAVHIVSVLAMPHLAPRDAYAVFSDWGGVNEFLSPPATDAAHRFSDPALEMVVCRFDVSRGPVRITASVDSEHYLSLMFQSRTGQIFHALTDRAALRGKITALLARAEDIEALEDAEAEEGGQKELRLTPPTPTGLVIARALADAPSDRAAAKARLRALLCSAEKG